MNKIKKRTLVILILAVFVVLGAFIFLIRMESDGAAWAGFDSNDHTHNNGILTAGRVKDRDGELLLWTENGKRQYSDQRTIRLATLHAVGDPEGYIGGSAVSLFERQLMGYNMVNGVYSLSGQGRDVYLTVDAELNRVAYEALNGRRGCVAVVNYQTGELIVMMSSPSYDPLDPPAEPSYLNRFLAGTYPPGSIFKVLTAQAALENLDTANYHYTCTARASYADGDITCKERHGELDFGDALALSCNCAFADLATKLGGETMAQYVEAAGLSGTPQVDGYTVAKGEYVIAEGVNLGWSGVGQYHDLINPAAMLRYVSAIANGGSVVEMKLLDKVTTTGGIPASLDLFKDKTRILDSEVAATLKEMMAYNVRKKYGVESFPGLPLCAKSGTAEVESGASPHSWFMGFLNSEEHPYAFIVLVENGGDGAMVAGSVANKVLQAAVSN